MQLWTKCWSWKLQRKARKSNSFVPPAVQIDVWISQISLHNIVLIFIFRLILPTSSPRWQKNQIDIKMYIAGVVQVDFSLQFFFFHLFLASSWIPALTCDTPFLFFSAPLQFNPVHSRSCSSPSCQPDGAILPVSAKTVQALSQSKYCESMTLT